MNSTGRPLEIRKLVLLSQKAFILLKRWMVNEWLSCRPNRLGNSPYQGPGCPKRIPRSGLGFEPFETIEVKAKTRGIKSITLSTKSYQAKDFYLKAGYQIYATLENVPQAGITKYHFIKWLSE